MQNQITAPQSDFYGFIAFHTLDGSVQRIVAYNQGGLTADIMPNNTSVNQITREAKLFKATLDNTMAITKSNFYLWQNLCTYCNRYCGQPYFEVGGIYDNYEKNQERLRKHCGTSYAGGSCTANNGCRELHGSMYCKCITHPSLPDEIKKHCTVCGVLGCTNSHGSSHPPCAYCGASCQQWVDYRYGHIHTYSINNKYVLPFNSPAMHYLHSGCDLIDKYDNCDGYEYKHNLTTKYQNNDIASEKRRLKDFIINNVRNFKLNNNFIDMGQAIHPVLDMLFLTVPERVSMLNYYTYSTFQDIIPVGHPMSGTRDEMYRRFIDLVLNLPSNPSEGDIESIIDMLDASLVDI